MAKNFFIDYLPDEFYSSAKIGGNRTFWWQLASISLLAQETGGTRESSIFRF